MMDGQVAAIRAGLDAAGSPDAPILAYAAKTASASTARSARPPTRRRRSATGAATRWTRRTRARRSARWRSTSTRAPTCCSSSRPCRRSTSWPRARERFDAADRRLPGERRVRPDRGRRRRAAGSTGGGRSSRPLTSIVRAGAASSSPTPRRTSRPGCARSRPMTGATDAAGRADPRGRPRPRAPRTSSRAASTAPSGPSARSGGRRSSSTRAPAPRVRDADGRWYVDYIGSWGPAILGHAHPAVVEAVRAAALDGFALGATSPARGRAGRGDPGGDAVDGADALHVVRHRGGDERHPPRPRRDRPRPRRQVRRRLPRPLATACSSRPARASPRWRSPAAPASRRASPRATDRRPLQRPRRGRGRLRAPSRPDRGGHRRAGRRERRRHPAGARASSRASASSPPANGALLIFDEVITGFRVAHGGAQERYGVRPGPDGPRQDRRRRACRSAPTAGGATSWTWSRRRAPSTRPARSPATRWRWPPASRRSRLLDAAALRRARGDGRRAGGGPARAAAAEAGRTVAITRVGVAAHGLLPRRRRATTRRRGDGRRPRRLRPLLRGDARRRRPPAAVAVRGLVHLARPRSARSSTRPSRRRGRRSGHDRRRPRPSPARRRIADAAGRPWPTRARTATCAPAAASRSTSRPSGSCARPDARCPSTGRSASGPRSSRSPATRPSAPRSPSSRSAGSASTRRSSSPTSPPRSPASACDFEIAPGVGPVIERPIRSARDVERLRPFEPAEAVGSAARGDRADPGRESPVPLIGFAGAPFTLACYLIEGGPSREFLRTQTFMHARAGGLGRAHGPPRRRRPSPTSPRRSRPGAQAVQVFDSWVGGL